MNKKIICSLSLFAVMPLIVFSMIFPIALLSFSALKTDTSAIKVPSDLSDGFSRLPSDGSHPVEDYIRPVAMYCEQLNELPQIEDAQRALPEDAKAIYPADLSQNGNLLINDTNYEVDIDRAISAFAPATASDGSPLVLVLHSHATECFTSHDQSYTVKNSDGTTTNYYSPSQTDTRSTDNTQNVVFLGKIFSDRLNELGIPTLHCETQHDYPDYNLSYTNSAKTVKKYLAEYPTIKYVIDLHRDSIQRQNGDKVKPLCQIDGQDTAQIMLVMGSGANHPDWRENLSLALKFKSVCESLYPGFCRPVYLRSWSFNQQLCSGSMILEVGTCGSFPEEAQRAAKLAADMFAATINP